MRITRVIIKNFRSFCDQGIDIKFDQEPFPVSIVGHNNSGKSNFLLAVQYCLGKKSTITSEFSATDFYFSDTTRKILIEVHIDPPLPSSNAFNSINHMPIFQLKISCEEGLIKVQHNCCGADGKPMYNATSVKRAKGKSVSEEERKILNNSLKDGTEYAYKHKEKVPLIFIDPLHLHDALKVNRFSLLGKVVAGLKDDFEKKENVVPDTGAHKNHVGMPRAEVFEQALQYLEKYIIRSPELDSLINKVEEIIKAQLDIECQDFKFHFGFPDVSSFYENLKFYITDYPGKPKMPVTNMGNGFLSLFIVALFRAILNSDEGGKIIILEEPETFLHEHFQEYFYQTLCLLAEKNQIIYSTHSKKFVNLFEPDSIIRFACSSFVKTEAMHKSTQEVNIPNEVAGFTIENPKDFGKYMRTLEPNLGNLIFASRVLIVEGPHDLLGYTMVLSKEVSLGLRNIAIICAWGKDPICTVVQLCKKFKIPYFVIHDWDMDNPDADLTNSSDISNPEYAELPPMDKQQFTKNRKIFLEAGSTNIHVNKRNLEKVLNIEDKGTVSVFYQLHGKSLGEIVEQFPDFLSEELLRFFDVPFTHLKELRTVRVN